MTLPPRSWKEIVFQHEISSQIGVRPAIWRRSGLARNVLFINPSVFTRLSSLAIFIAVILHWIYAISLPEQQMCSELLSRECGDFASRHDFYTRSFQGKFQSWLSRRSTRLFLH
jgi:hypothetical protein